MHKIFTTSLILLASTALCSAQIDISNGLIAYWPLDSNAQDMSGNGKHGTVNGASLTTDRDGRANKAYSFNGSGNTITVGNIASSFGGEITFSFWAMSSVSKDQSVFIGTPDNASNRLNCHYNYNHSGNNVIMFDYGDIYNKGRLDVNPFTMTSNWTHVVVSSSATKDSMFIYVDGVLRNKKKGHNTYASTTGGFSIGGTTGLYFNGSVDEFRVHNRLLRNAEIQYLFNADPLSIPKTKELSAFAYPNPSSDGQFKLSSATLINKIKIMDATGRAVQEANEVNEYNTALDLSAHASGVYFVQITDINNASSTVRLLKN